MDKKEYTPLEKTLTEIVCEEIESKNIPVMALAKKAGLHYNLVYAMTRRGAVASIRTLSKLTDALGMEINVTVKAGK
jgi:DNA-binding phage protein